MGGIDSADPLAVVVLVLLVALLVATYLDRFHALGCAAESGSWGSGDSPSPGQPLSGSAA
jgi:hypothetical protein